MHFNVPQFIEIEDKIAFQLTAKQLGWFALGGVILYVIWQFVVPVVFYIWVAVIGLLATAFAFYKPHGIPLHQFLTSGFGYLVKPKVLVWERKGVIEKEIKKTFKEKKKTEIDLFMKEKEMKKVADFAKILDKNSKL